MAGYTNYCYRQITRQLGGVGLSATEMINARGFLEIDARFHEYPDRLWGVKEEPRPLAVQIWENDPQTLARTGQRLAREFGVSVVDINFGCPVKDVTERAKSGSYLLRWPERIGQIVARGVEACRPTPVTAKIRLGCTRDAINAIDVAQAVEDAGGAAITVHGRTAQDMFRGSADWDQIAAIEPHLRRIPPILRRRSDDRPWRPQQTMALSPGSRGIAGKNAPSRSVARRATGNAFAALPTGRGAVWRAQGDDLDAEVRLLLRARPPRGEVLSPPRRARKHAGGVLRRGGARLPAKWGGCK